MEKESDTHGYADHRDIMLLLILGKVFTPALLITVLWYMRNTNHPEQAGIMQNRSSIDHSSVLKLIVEKHREFQNECHLSISFIDLKAVFDSFDWPSLLFILWSIGMPHMTVDLLTKFHDRAESCARLNGQDLPLFPFTTGRWQAVWHQNCSTVWSTAKCWE